MITIQIVLAQMMEAKECIFLKSGQTDMLFMALIFEGPEL